MANLGLGFQKQSQLSRGERTPLFRLVETRSVRASDPPEVVVKKKNPDGTMVMTANEPLSGWMSREEIIARLSQPAAVATQE